MHLSRLTRLWSPSPIIFITTGTVGRRKLLDSSDVVAVLRTEWQGLHQRHGWAVGRYVVMPDHVHFFVCQDSLTRRPLSTAIGKWKEWTSRRISRITQSGTPIWQPAFFDRVLRSEGDFADTWAYVRENPVRAGLVDNAAEWPFAGAIDFETARSGPATRPM